MASLASHAPPSWEESRRTLARVCMNMRGADRSFLTSHFTSMTPWGINLFSILSVPERITAPSASPNDPMSQELPVCAYVIREMRTCWDGKT